MKHILQVLLSQHLFQRSSCPISSNKVINQKTQRKPLGYMIGEACPHRPNECPRAMRGPALQSHSSFPRSVEEVLVNSLVWFVLIKRNREMRCGIC